MSNVEKLKLFAKENAHLLILLVIIALAFSIRTVRIPTQVADYDPWWYFRHTQDVLNYGFNLPKWDIQSYFPPGRPYIPFLGTEWFLALSYKLATLIVKNLDFLKFFIIAPALVSALSAIPAYLASRLISNKTGGLFTAVFSIAAPTFIGYSVAGYMDSKAFVMLYSFLAIFTMMLALKKKSIPYYILAILTNVLFVYSWLGGGWYPLITFMLFLPAVVMFRIFEQVFHNRKLKVDFQEIKLELKSLLIPYLIILIATNVITQALGLSNIVQYGILPALGFVAKINELLVNISVAELQIINPFTKDGFTSVSNQVGMITTVLTIIGLPLLVAFKLWRKEKVRFEEIFLFLFAALTFYMILHGIRFSLIFSVAASLTAGYVLGNMFEYIKKIPLAVVGTTAGVVIATTFILVSNAYQYAVGTSNAYGLDDNWKNALEWLKSNGDNSTIVATWWDPGHIIAGYTGLKVHADGAHCVPQECVPFNHNIRIQDMGRAFSTNNETESVNILQKYMQLTPDQCQEVKQKYGDIIYDNILHDNPCGKLKKMYFIASNDLIGKYFWMSCFGNFDIKKWDTGERNPRVLCSNAQNFEQMPLVNVDQSGALIYSDGFRTVTLIQNNTQVLAFLSSPQEGIRNQIVSDFVFYNQNGQEQNLKASGGNTFDGMIWLDPGARGLFFMTHEIRDSMFTKMFFFNGKDLTKFKLTYSNPEIKIYEVKFD